MLDHLTERLSGAFKSLRGQAQLTETNIQDALRDVRIALLEADVALPVVKTFIEDVRQEALGQAVLQSLTPGQAFIGIVHRTLTRLMGEHNEGLNLAAQPPAVILMAGLQGAGKTTTTGKLAKWLKEQQKKKVLVVSCDVYRPAAIEQLRILSESLEIECFPSDLSQQPDDIARNALDYARRHFHDVLLVDTAGRLTIDEPMMQEIRQLHGTLQPVETLFVVDAMQGQDAVNTARAFGEALPLTGIILTKLDGDARGGAALSVRHITQRPIKFIGVGEKLTGLEAFHPERMASRVLGMGDVLTLIEEAQRNVDQVEAEKLAKKLKKGHAFDLEDFKAQLQQMRKAGGIGAMMDKLPSQLTRNMAPGAAPPDENSLRRIEGIINAMTPLERRKPELLKASRKRRIAAGSGVQVQEINRLLTQFEQMQKMMKLLSQGGGMSKMLRGMRNLIPGR